MSEEQEYPDDTILALRKELRDCYRMIADCVSLQSVTRKGFSTDLLHRARIEAKYNHSFQDIPEDESGEM